jgi:hypothetical protein
MDACRGSIKARKDDARPLTQEVDGVISRLSFDADLTRRSRHGCDKDAARADHVVFLKTSTHVFAVQLTGPIDNP